MKNLIHYLRLKIAMIGFKYRLWQTDRYMKKFEENRVKNVSRETRNESPRVQNLPRRKMVNDQLRK